MRQRGGITPRLTGWFSLQRLEAFTEMLEATMGDPGGIARNTRSQKQRPSSCHEPLIPQSMTNAFVECHSKGREGGERHTSGREGS